MEKGWLFCRTLFPSGRTACSLGWSSALIWPPEHLKISFPVISQPSGKEYEPQDIDLITVTAGRPHSSPSYRRSTRQNSRLCLGKTPHGHPSYRRTYMRTLFLVEVRPPQWEAEPPVNKDEKIGFPLLCLVVSGGIPN